MYSKARISEDKSSLYKFLWPIHYNFFNTVNNGRGINAFNFLPFDEPFLPTPRYIAGSRLPNMTHPYVSSTALFQNTLHPFEFR